MNKIKITLTKEKQTLLIPLYTRALESLKPNPVIIDPKASEILDKIDYHFNSLNFSAQTIAALCMRANKIDLSVKEFINANPDGIIIHAGCGLDSRFIRTGNNTIQWYDLDYPEVINLRRHFYKETPKYKMISSSVTDINWIKKIKSYNKAADNKPVMFIAEGLMMYLQEKDVKNIILNLEKFFPGSEIIFDVYNTFAANQINLHPAIINTGAVLKWGIDNTKDILQWSSQIKLKQEWLFIHSDDLIKLPFHVRIFFYCTALFPLMRNSHRIIHLQV
ncbi:SAM-dependent methyltransferase, Ppm1/Ppm2/Tcmp-like [Desulfonema limicola]|uniref:SAM-dependent methyltransferase, Ppm1/Ppm2/Tcmp-like n=1 Tax=Desulfonema limicola TaxID=45656 RepID=A0A975B6U7_9BACT|nr:class I SAM-dependent methyltransferase [Desulfonema limicola]QTA79863.1 SAM-dependent methyltransferase, Ppm1/Ppm2/Tcmp-like [Desulfonema limicola]